jgi:putative hydrolase of the HAD superfamily
VAALAELRAYHDRHNLWESVPPDVIPALTRVRAAGLQLAVVSNANGTLRAVLERLGLAPFFRTVLDSREEGVEKPDPRIFEIALARCGARPQATVHVGDFYHVDVEGARAAGLRAVLLDAAGLYSGFDCPRVSSLSTLAEALTQHR